VFSVVLVSSYHIMLYRLDLQCFCLQYFDAVGWAAGRATLFFGNSPTGQTGSNDVESRKDVPFGVSFTSVSVLGVRFPQTPFLGNRRFQAKRAKNSNFHIFKITTSIAIKLCTVIKTTKYHLCMSQTNPRCQMIAIFKNRKIAISLQRIGIF